MKYTKNAMNWVQENAEMRTGKRSGSFAGGGTTCDRLQRSSMVPIEATNCWEGEGEVGEREWITAQTSLRLS